MSRLLRVGRPLGNPSRCLLAGCVEIITGRGLHSSDGEARLRPLVQLWLEANWASWRPKPGNPGAFEMFPDRG